MESKKKLNCLTSALVFLKETEMKVNEAGGDAAARWLDSRKLRLDAHKKTLSRS